MQLFNKSEKFGCSIFGFEHSIFKSKRSVSFRNWLPRFFLLFAILVNLSLALIEPSPTLATVDQDNSVGFWNDDFGDTSGVNALTNVARDNFDNSIKLTDGSGSIVQPFSAEGSFRTNTVIPFSVSSWDSIEIDADIPGDTEILLQILDEKNYVYSNDILAGNESGIPAESVLDISSVPVTSTANDQGQGRHSRLRVKFILRTDDNTQTPAINEIQINWVPKSGDLSPSPPADYYPYAGLSAPNGMLPWDELVDEFWVPVWNIDYGGDHGGSAVFGENNDIIVKTGGGFNAYPFDYIIPGKFSSIDRDTGNINYQKNWTGTWLSTSHLAKTANNTILMSDVFNDIVVAYDGYTGEIKWSYPFYSGHQSSPPSVSDNGNVFITRGMSSDLVIVKLNSSGEEEWSVSETMCTSGISNYSPMIYEGKVIAPGACYNDYNSSDILALDESDGSQLWKAEDVGNAQRMSIDSGILYVATNSDMYGSGVEGGIHAIDLSDGDILWSQSYPIDYAIGNSPIILKSNNLVLSIEQRYYDTSYNVYPEHFNTSGILTIDKSTGNISDYHSFDDKSVSLINIDSEDNYMVTATHMDEVEQNIDYSGFRIYDSSYERIHAFKYESPGVENARMYDSGAILDSGELYLTYAIQPQDSSEYFKQTYLTKFEPLEIDLNFDAENYSPGDEVTITVNSNLIPTSAFANSDNQIQIVTDWGGRIVLEYVGGEAGAQTWQGSFVIPEDLEPGSYGLSLQVSIFGIEGGAETDFAQPLPNTNGQGYVSNFNIEVTDASLVETGENIMKTIGIFLALGLGLQMIFSKSRKPFNIRKFHQRR